MGLQAHPYARLFPPMSDKAFEALRQDLAENGQHEPIVITADNKILDGMHRYTALARMQAEIKTEVFEGTEAEALALVVSKNLHRRHLNGSQRAMVSDKLADMKQGARTDLASIEAKSQVAAAEMMNVSRSSVQRAGRVRAEAEPEIVEAVEAGRMELNTAVQAKDLPAEDQRAIAESDNPKSEVKKRRRAAREKGLAAATAAAGAALGTTQYGVIYADPPWRFEPYSRETGMDRAADNYYGTLVTADIAGLDVPGAAHTDCVLYLWATAPMLPDALDVMQAWGFGYKTNMVWSKNKTGTGYWARNKHEHLLIGTRGNVPAPAPGDQPESVAEEKVGIHSAKPAWFRSMIERLYPNVPRLEMFARESADGWDAWGNEVNGSRPDE